jgi:predicted kinase
MTKPTLTVLIGAAGSGKSTYARRWKPSQVISSDRLREVVCDDPSDQAATSDAFALLHQIVEMRLGRGLDTVIDATNSHSGHRHALLALARQEGACVHAVVMATTLAECIVRNARRAPCVPESALRAQHGRIVADLPNLEREGFCEVEYIGTGAGLEVADGR